MQPPDDMAGRVSNSVGSMSHNDYWPGAEGKFQHSLEGNHLHRYIRIITYLEVEVKDAFHFETN
jgi:hypothetical protein